MGTSAVAAATVCVGEIEEINTVTVVIKISCEASTMMRMIPWLASQLPDVKDINLDSTNRPKP